MNNLDLPPQVPGDERFTGTNASSLKAVADMEKMLKPVQIRAENRDAWLHSRLVSDLDNIHLQRTMGPEVYRNFRGLADKYVNELSTGSGEAFSVIYLCRHEKASDNLYTRFQRYLNDVNHPRANELLQAVSDFGHAHFYDLEASK